MAIIGNTKVVDFLTKAWADKNLSHAYCFVGPNQVGKNTISRYLASKLLVTTKDKLNTHPDLYYLTREIDEKTDQLKKSISIKQARQLKLRISNKAWLGQYRVVIIDGAEYLNKESGNALLKVLEETQNNTVFFVLTTDDNLLLPTIKSRCQLFYLPLVPDNELVSGLSKAGYDKSKIDQILPIVWGRPGRAIDLLNDQTNLEIYSKEHERWQNILNEPLYKRLQLVKDLLNKKDGINKEKLQETLDIWIMIWRQVLKDKVDSADNELSKKSQLNQIQIVDLIDIMKKTKILLKQNINPSLLIEQIFLTEGLG